MPRKTERYVIARLSVREQKATVDALMNAARAAPAGSRFRQWATDIAGKIREAKSHYIGAVAPCPK